MNDAICPHCGSTNIQGHDLDSTHNTYIQEVDCLTCDAEFTNVYTLSSQPITYIKEDTSNE